MHTEIENLLAERLGFDIETVGRRAVETVIEQSMEKAGIANSAAYARTLVRDPEAWQKLVERVVIPETWFFRDRAPYEFAAGAARLRMSRAGGDGVLRILSCPCSTGEEPYSLAMALLDAGVRPESFVVDAVDVSRRALEVARSALFRKRSFREASDRGRERYFESAGNGSWRLTPMVASLVRFQPGNLVVPGFLTGQLPYDIIFCRNLLIYLHTGARLAAMAVLRRLLADDGVLVMGHAEAIFAREHGFRATGPAAAFALTKPAAMGSPEVARSASVEHVERAACAPLAARLETPQHAQTVPAGEAGAQRDVRTLDVALELGNSGKLQEALLACREFLESAPASPAGYFLLGVLHDALGLGDLAISDFRKVLYLDPAHQDALLHLALKQEAQGNRAGAELLRARARRAQNSQAGK